MKLDILISFIILGILTPAMIFGFRYKLKEAGVKLRIIRGHYSPEIRSEAATFLKRLSILILVLLCMNVAFYMGATTYNTSGTYLSDSGDTVIVSEEDVVLNGNPIEYQAHSAERSFMFDHWVVGMLLGILIISLVIVRMEIEAIDINQEAGHETDHEVIH